MLLLAPICANTPFKLLAIASSTSRTCIESTVISIVADIVSAVALKEPPENVRTLCSIDIANAMTVIVMLSDFLRSLRIVDLYPIGVSLVSLAHEFLSKCRPSALYLSLMFSSLNRGLKLA
jgi:hypothetical protein